MSHADLGGVSQNRSAGDVASFRLYALVGHLLTRIQVDAGVRAIHAAEGPLLIAPNAAGGGPIHRRNMARRARPDLAWADVGAGESGCTSRRRRSANVHARRQGGRNVVVNGRALGFASSGNEPEITSTPSRAWRRHRQMIARSEASVATPPSQITVCETKERVRHRFPIPDITS